MDQTQNKFTEEELFSLIDIESSSGKLDGNYKSLKSWIELLDPDNKKACKQLLAFLKKEYSDAEGASLKYQPWKGDYDTRLENLLNMANVIYLSLYKFRQLDFAFEQSIVVLFLHDLEKTFPNIVQKESQDTIISRYGFVLSNEQKNALHLEQSTDSLATFCQICDTISAQTQSDMRIS